MVSPYSVIARVRDNTYDSSFLLCGFASIRVIKFVQVLDMTSNNGRPSGLLGVVDLGVANFLAVQRARIFDVRHVEVVTEVIGMRGTRKYERKAEGAGK